MLLRWFRRVGLGNLAIIPLFLRAGHAAIRSGPPRCQGPINCLATRQHVVSGFMNRKACYQPRLLMLLPYYFTEIIEKGYLILLRSRCLRQGSEASQKALHSSVVMLRIDCRIRTFRAVIGFPRTNELLTGYAERFLDGNSKASFHLRGRLVARCAATFPLPHLSRKYLYSDSTSQAIASRQTPIACTRQRSINSHVDLLKL